MDNLSLSIIALDVHFADKSERLRHAWEIVHAKLVGGQKPTTNNARDEILRLLDSADKRLAKSHVVHVGQLLNEIRAKLSPVA